MKEMLSKFLNDRLIFECRQTYTITFQHYMMLVPMMHHMTIKVMMHPSLNILTEGM